MKKLIIYFIVILNLSIAQSNWQVYKTPYDDSINLYTFSDNTGSPPFLKWMKNSVGFNYTSIPILFRNGFVQSINSWNNNRFNITSGTDVSINFLYDEFRGYFARAPVTVNNQTGEIISGMIYFNMGTYGVNQINWNNNGLSYFTFDSFGNPVYYCDVQSTITHEIGHIFGLYHHKTGSGRETMSTWDQANNLDFSPSERKNIKPDDWSAFNFLYRPPITSAYIIGPSNMYNEGIYVYTATAVDGYQPFSYSWEMKKNNSFRSNSIILAAPGDQWVPIGNNSKYLTISPPPTNGDWRDFELRCTITDIRPGVSKTSNVIYVDLENISPPQSNKNEELQNHHINNVENEIIDTDLDDCYPNPFNPSTNIKYKIHQGSYVILKIYNSLGQEVAKLVDEYKNLGIYQVQFNAFNLPSGIYFYKLQTNNKVISKKMLLAK